MLLILSRLSFILLPILLYGCVFGEDDSKESNSNTTTSQVFAFEIPSQTFSSRKHLLKLTVFTTDSTLAYTVKKEAQATFNYYLNQWFSWRDSYGLLKQINANLEKNYATILNKDSEDYLKKLLHFSQRSNGKFNPALGKITTLWESYTSLPNKKPPPPKLINKLIRQQPSMQNLIFDVNGVYTTDPNTSIEIHSTMAGFLIEKIFQSLLSFNLKKATITVHNTHKVILENTKKTPFLTPVSSMKISLCHGAAWTTLSKDDKTHHIIDPKTGRPFVDSPLQSVTVFSNDAILAQASAMAAFIAGPDWQKQIDNMNTPLSFVKTVENEYKFSTNLREQVENDGHATSNCSTK